MALRHDAIYAVNLRDPPPVSKNSPPPVIQLRLTEEVLQQIAARSSEGDDLSIKVFTDGPEPKLVISGADFPLKLTPESAPNEIFRLNSQETKLTKIGNVDTKFSVRPSAVSASAAHRLKERREEEDLRKEERRKAVLVDHPISATNLKRSSSRSSRPSQLIATSRSHTPVSPSLVSPASKALPFTKLGQPRDSSLSRDTQRSPTQPNDAVQPRSVGTLAGISATKSGLGSPFYSNRALSPDARASSVSASFTEDADTSHESSPISSVSSKPGPSSSADKETTKTKKGALTTRQRLAKAAKGGSRILPDSQKKAAAVASATKARPAVSSKELRSSEARNDPAVVLKGQSVAPSKEPEPVSGQLGSAPERGSSLAAMRSAERSRTDIAHTRPLEANSESRQDKHKIATAQVGDVVSSNVNVQAQKAVTASPKERRAKEPPDASIKARTSPVKSAEATLSPGIKRPREEDSPDRVMNRQSSGSMAIKRSRTSSFVEGGRPNPPSSQPHQSASPVRPSVKGVGHGATHWSEPWLDVRSVSDWKRLAERFNRMGEEYSANRRRLGIESARLDLEMALARREQEHQDEYRSYHEQNQGTEPAPVRTQTESDSNGGLGITIAADPQDGGSDSLEEGEMADSDSDQGQSRLGGRSTSALGLSVGGPRTRSASPELLAWRSGNQLPLSLNTRSDSSTSSGSSSPPYVVTPQDDQPPLTYKELVLLVEKTKHLHGSLERMKRVLCEFKDKHQAQSH